MSLNPYSWLSGPIDWALRHLSSAFESIPVFSLIGAFGLAVISVTLGIRVLLFPLYQWQLKTQRRVSAEQRLVAPQMQALRKKYRNDPQARNAAVLELYREHGISPLSQLSGCLPLLIQLPIIGGLYSGIRAATGEVHSLSFLWIQDLGQTAKDAAGSYSGLLTHPQLLVLPVLAAGLTFLQSKIATAPPRPDMSDQERQVYNTSKNIVVIMPVVILFMGLTFYQGITLYWVTQSVVMILQQFYLLGWGGLSVPDWVPGSGYTPPLSYRANLDTTLAALGSKPVTAPLSTPKRISGNRDVAPRPRPGSTDTPGGGARRGTPARPTGRARPASGRVAQQTAGGSRRRRGR